MPWQKRYINKRELNPAYNIFRSAVRKRDKNRCQFPGCKKAGREVHHIIKYADSNYLKHEVDNGILLCKDHHEDVKGKEGHYVKTFSDIVLRKKQK